VASADDSPGLSSLLNSGVTFFGWMLKGVSWLTQSPLIILLLLLAAFFYEIARRIRLAAARDSTPGRPTPNAEPVTATAPPKRRRGRRRGVWRKLIRQVRTSLGFPIQEMMREKDFSSPRRRRGRRRGTWRALVRQVSASLGFPGKEMLREKDFRTPRRRSRRH